MKIREKPIGFNECDEAAEVCKWFNEIFKIARDHEARIAKLEPKPSEDKPSVKKKRSKK